MGGNNMKNCTNCGASLEDWASSCHICGTAQMVNVQPQMGYNQQQMGYNQPQMGYNQQQSGYDQSQMGYAQPYTVTSAPAPKQANKTVIIVVLIVALLAVVGVILAIVLLNNKKDSGSSSTGFQNGTKQEVLESYYNAMVEEDAETVVACMYTDDLLDALLDAEGYTRDELYDEVEDMYFEGLYSDWEDVKNIEIVDEDEMSDSDIDVFNESFEDMYDVECNITEMYVCDIDYEYYDGYYDSWEEDTDTLLVFKMDGGWYVSQW